MIGLPRMTSARRNVLFPSVCPIVVGQRPTGMMFESRSTPDLPQVRRSVHAAGAAVSLGILGLLLGGICYPLSSRMDFVRQKSQATQRFLATERSVRNEHEELQSRFSELDARREGIMARIPPQANESEFLEQMAGIAESCGLVLREYRPGTVTRHESYSEMEIFVNAHGDYESVCYFFDGLERLSRYCQLADFEIDASSGLQRFPVKLKLRIFFKPANASSPHA